MRESKRIFSPGKMIILGLMLFLTLFAATKGVDERTRELEQDVNHE
jgi:hypothetical protein